jgi:hypothetical protein
MKTKNNGTENDRFSRMIRDKLANYALPPEAESWEALEKRISERNRKRIPLWPWLSGLTAAASVALLLFNSYHQKQVYNEITDNVSHHAERLAAIVPAEETLPAADPAARSVQPAPSHPAGRRPANPEFAFHKSALTEATPAAPDTPSTDEEAVNSKADRPSTLHRPEEVFPEEKPALSQRKAAKRRGSFGVHISTGGGLYAANNTLRYAANTYSSELRSADNNRPQPEAFGKIVHRPPLSVGLSVRKTLSEYVSIESGLTYSYLYSTFESKAPQREASMTLHYLGLPVYLSFDLIPRSRGAWGLYLSAGGMVEKGLTAHYMQNVYNFDKNVVIQRASNEKIDGLQWSVQAALGVSYRLHRNYSLFLEPKVSYYLDNNQPLNARTEHPFVPGLNIGLRHTW